MNRKQLPSEKAETKRTAKVEAEERKKEAESRLRGAVARLSQTDDGVIFLQWLKAECGWGVPPIVANPSTGEVNERSSLYQAFRQSLWWKVRRLIPINRINEVEHNED